MEILTMTNTALEKTNNQDIEICGIRSEEKNKFIDLRAKGYSYSKIANILHISKGTLTVWNNELKGAIEKLRVIQLDELYTKYYMLKAARITQLGKVLGKVDKELEARDFSQMPDDKLLDFKLRLIKELKEEYIEPQEDKTIVKLNAQEIASELLTLLVRLRKGEISKEQAYRENSILGSLLKVDETYRQMSQINVAMLTDEQLKDLAAGKAIDPVY
jgi:hypothetical protein